MVHGIHPLYSDTDSFLLKIVAKDESAPTPNDIYRVNSKYFDFSNFPTTHPLYHTRNLRSILCSCDTIHRAKGVPKAAANELVHADYLHTLRKKQPKTSLFCNTKFQTQTLHSGYRKIALSAFDDKRYILDDGITSLAYGDH